MASTKGKKNGKTMTSKEMKKVKGGLSVDQSALGSLKQPVAVGSLAPAAKS
jgi:hypothetical protein